MNKIKYIFFITAVMAAAFLAVFPACDLGYVKEVIVNAETPVIEEHPESVGVLLNSEVTLTVVVEEFDEDAVGAGTLSYQWYQFLTFRAYEEQVGDLIDGADEDSFMPPTGSEGEFNYYVVVTNHYPRANGRKLSSVKSDPVTVTVNDPDNARYPVITGQPSGATLLWSPRISLPALEVVAAVELTEEEEEEGLTLSDELRYQWYFTETLTNTVGVPIAGATTSRLIPPLAIPGQEEDPDKPLDPTLIRGAGSYYYFAVVTNYFFSVPGRRTSSVASNPVLVSIGVNPDAAPPVIRAQPKSAIFFTGVNAGDVQLKVEVEEPEDGGTLSYQWYSNKTASNSGGKLIKGATDEVYNPAVSVTRKSTTYYYAVVTNTNSYVTNPTAVTASRAAEITVMNPANQSANATFTVQFGGANQYQFVRGFGGMDVAWGNFPNYDEDDYENMYNPDILGYNMLRIMILPTYTDINRTLNELIANQIYTTMDRSRYYENVKTVNRYGGYVLASPWSPPAAWKTNNSINGGGSLRVSDYKNYGNYLRAYAQNMLNNGAPVYAVSIQNEPNYVAGYDGCEWTGDEMRNFYRTDGVMRFTAGIAGFGGGRVIDSVRTMNGESANTTTVHRSAMSNGIAKGNIDILARHNYGSRNDNGAGTGAVSTDNWVYHATGPREIWMTEHNLNSNSGTSYPNDHTWNYIWLFMNDVDMSVRINHEAAFIWWSSKRFYSMLGDGTYGSADHEILPRGWGLAHYAKFANETYRVGVSYEGTTKSGVPLREYDRETGNGNVNGNHYADFESTTVKVSAFMKLKGGEVYPVNWRNQSVPISDVEEITMVMFTPTSTSGSGGYDMGTVKLQLPAGFRISGASAMRSDPTIFNRGSTNRGTPKWESVQITADRSAAFVTLPVSTILSVRFTQ